MGRPVGSKNKPKTQAPSEVSETPLPSPEDTSGQTNNQDDDSAPVKVRYAHEERLDLLNEIEEINNEKRAAEEAKTESPTDEPETEQVEDEPPVETADVVTTALTTPSKQKFTVDGVEQEFTEEQVRAFVQKHATADKRLEEASRLHQDAQRASAATLLSRGQTSQPSAVTSLPADVGSDVLISQITEALYTGDKEQVQEAVATLLGKGRHQVATQTQGMTQQEILGYVQGTLAFERGNALMEAAPENGGFADIKNDPMLFDMFKAKEAEHRNVLNDNRPHPELYREIGTKIRAWKDDLIKQNLPKTGLEGRDALKRETGIVRSAGGRIPSAETTKKPLTTEDFVNEQRRVRGLM